MLTLVKRNLRLYFRDKAAVFFSMLGVLILLGMYLVFLMDLITPPEGAIPNIESSIFARSWVMAGVIAITSVNTTLAAYMVLVNDVETHVDYDFKVSPIKRTKIVLSYIISSLIIGFVMSFIALMFSQIYIYASGGTILSFTAILKALFVILLGVTMTSSVIFFLVNFIKSTNAMGAINAVFGSIVGFLMGVYVPMGVLGSSVEGIVKVVPFSHTAAMMRQVMVEDILPAGGVLTDLDSQYYTTTHELGILYYFNDKPLSFLGHVLICLGVTILFFGLGVIAYNKKRK